MSSAFSNLLPKGQPTWSSLATVPANFTKMNVFGTSIIPEVGYSQEGYGQGGYDTLAQGIAGVTFPVWFIYPAPIIYSAISLIDSNGVSWNVTVDVTGHLITNPGISPAGALSYLNLSDLLIVLSDISGNLWNVFVLPTGNLDTQPIRQGLAFFNSIYLKDANSHIWILTVSLSGNLVTA